MSNILKLIYLVSLILYSLCTDCSTLQKAACQAASTECTYSESAAETCEGSGCTVVTGTTTCQTSDGCSFTNPDDTSIVLVLIVHLVVQLVWKQLDVHM